MGLHRKLVCFIVAFLFGLPAMASTRRALVIGNDSYPGNELQNARNDAKGISAALSGIGYKTTLALDVNRAGLSDTVDTFVDSLAPGDTAILYYAGHGFQLEGENYLVPVDFKVVSSAVAKEQGYPISSILERFTSHGATTQIIVLDACRNNPFLGTRSTKGGWAGLGTSAGSFLAFGTSPGSTASDAPSEGHGLFTKDLLKYLTSSNQDIEEMFRNVREDVIRDSNGTQVPWVASSLIGTFHVRPDQDLTDRLLPDISDRHTELAGVYERSFRSNSANTPQMGTLTPDLSSRLDQARDLVRGGKLEEAASILQDVLRLNPACAAALDLLGLIFHRESRDEMALDTFGRALLENPQDSAAAAYKCAVEQLMGRPSARNDCSDLALNHPSAGTYLVLALAQHSNGDEIAAYNSATTSIMLADSQSTSTSSEARQERKLTEGSSQP